jgi:hypothetical protein
MVPGRSEPSSTYGERKITQMKELKLLFYGLDLDEGIRIVAEMSGYPNGAFVFATRCGDKLCVSVKERVLDKELNDYVPGGKEQWKYFETPDAAWQYYSKFVKQPIEAYYY